MKEIKYLGLAICLLIITSCSTTKNVENSPRDGSSFEKAIIVKSVAEEYEYVRKVCTDCQLLGQSLSYYNQKPFDIIRMKKSNGDDISYHFDISKFFGKGF